MAKIRIIKQAYPVTLRINGKDVPPGTMVALPQDEADKIAVLFGVLQGTRAAPAAASKPDQAAIQANKPDLAALQAGLDEAQAAYDEAHAALQKIDAGNDEALAFEKAEARLTAAEKALEEAQEEAGGQ